jgi:hypothetical protein
MGVASRSRKNPHTPEWEAKRLASVREAMSRKQWPKGYKRPKEHTEPMLEGLRLARQRDPEKFKFLAVANLPKDVSGSQNGNWRGGKTKESKNFRIQQSGRFVRWRNAVLARDKHVCRECGTVERLEAHHIIPLCETRLLAFLEMNGVTLCRACHKKTDTYGSRAWKHRIRWEHSHATTGRRIFLIAVTVPHRWQAYQTVGNYSWCDDGTLVIFVSDMGNECYERLVFIHEAIEASLVKARGINPKSIDAFDMAFERDRDPGDESEPGDAPAALYRREHRFAENIERQLAHELGVDWQEYERAIGELS